MARTDSLTFMVSSMIRSDTDMTTLGTISGTTTSFTVVFPLGNSNWAEVWVVKAFR